MQRKEWKFIYAAPQLAEADAFERSDRLHKARHKLHEFAES